MELFIKNPSLHTRHAEMSQNLNVTHTDEWTRNNAWAAFLPIIVTVMKKPPVWKTTPSAQVSEWLESGLSLGEWAWWKQGWRGGWRAEGRGYCPWHLLSFPVFVWDHSTGLCLSAQEVSPGLDLGESENSVTISKKPAWSEHTFRAWS